MSEQLPTVGEMINTAIEERGLTQVQAYTALGCSKATLGHWRAGYTVPGLDRAADIARFVDRPVPEVVAAIVRESSGWDFSDGVAGATPGYLNTPLFDPDLAQVA